MADAVARPRMPELDAALPDQRPCAEAAERQAAGMPPFGRLAALILAGSDAERVKAEARRVARAAPPTEGILVLGPAPAPLALLRGRYRERLLVKAAGDVDLPTWLRAWLAPLLVIPATYWITGALIQVAGRLCLGLPPSIRSISLITVSGWGTTS